MGISSTLNKLLFIKSVDNYIEVYWQDQQNIRTELLRSALKRTGKALKDYSYLDQAPVGEIDLHKGLNNTLLILRNKLKYGISVEKDYDMNIPNLLTLLRIILIPIFVGLFYAPWEHANILTTAVFAA